MRWEELFDDLEARVRHEDRVQREAEVADRREQELAQVALVHRLTGTAGAPVGVQVSGGDWLEGTVTDVGVGWVLLASSDGRRQVLVAAAAVAAVRGLGRHAGPPPGGVAARRTLVLALRALARAGEPVLVRTRGGEVRGVLGRTGADHVDVDPQDRSAGPGAGTVTVPFTALLTVTGAL
jgi:hypothetical protein